MERRGFAPKVGFDAKLRLLMQKSLFHLSWQVPLPHSQVHASHDVL